MTKKILDIYSDYLICQNKYATATGLSDLLSGDIATTRLQNILILKIWDQKNYGYTSSRKLGSTSLQWEVF